MHNAILFAFAFLLLSSSQAQQVRERNDTPIVVKRLDGIITIDGLSNEPAWEKADSVSFFVLDPIYGATPGEETKLMLTYDDKFLYVAARCYYKDSSKIIARNFVRDSWRGDDWFAIDIDSRNDRQNAIRFALYPFGTHFDMAISNDGVELGSNTFNINYDLIWESKSVINKEGWFMEFKIPFSSLRFKAGEDETIMNISATRQSYHNNEQQHFPKVPQDVVERTRKPSLNQPFLFEGLKPTHLLYITPSLALGIKQEQQWNALKNKFEDQAITSIKPSFDVKYSLTTNIVADITINTDFSQAEVDDQQVNLSRFSLFYPEKRLFFQEQAGLFEFKLGLGSQLFYSRQIGLQDGNIIPIIGGARITGNLGKLDAGLINITTADKTIDDSVHVAAENFSVLRMRRKVFNQNSYIGGMLTNRIGGGYSNTSFGTDAIIKVKGQQYLLSSFAGSYDNKQKSRLTISQSRLSLTYDLRKRDKFFYNAQYGYSGPDFNPGIGFIDRSNYQLAGVLIGYGHYGKSKKETFKFKSASLNSLAFWNFQTGELETVSSIFSMSGTTFTDNVFSASITYAYEYLQDTLSLGNQSYVLPGNYSFAETKIEYTAPQFYVLKTPVSFTYGTFFDGTRFALSTSPGWSINKYFELTATYNFTYIDFRKRNSKTFLHLANIKFDWAFNLRISGTFLLQYNSDLKKVYTNVRTRYHFSDGHDFYLVLNANQNQDLFRNSKQYHETQAQQVLLKYIYTFH